MSLVTLRFYGWWSSEDSLFEVLVEVLVIHEGYIYHWEQHCEWFVSYFGLY